MRTRELKSLNESVRKVLKEFKVNSKGEPIMPEPSIPEVLAKHGYKHTETHDEEPPLIHLYTKRDKHGLHSINHYPEGADGGEEMWEHQPDFGPNKDLVDGTSADKLDKHLENYHKSLK